MTLIGKSSPQVSIEEISVLLTLTLTAAYHLFFVIGYFIHYSWNCSSKEKGKGFGCKGSRTWRPQWVVVLGCSEPADEGRRPTSNSQV